MPDPHSIDWNIQRRGHAWREEALSRYELAPGKIEMVDGKLFWNDKDRLTMLGLLLENVGIDQAVRLGDPRVWKSAIAALKD